MPKRPCAIQILPDNATIIIGDKFGDVYSLPLLPKVAEPENGHQADASAESEGTPQPESEKTDKPAFKPSATNLTVHTKRNLRALEAQMKQQSFTARKEPLKFEHKLLLGHVSMLTDALSARHQVEGQWRDYIITADRDEHIRISRGPPQAHIIEGYCLRHEEYISKICLIPGTDLLVSGGGDDWLGIWDWPTFTFRRKFSIDYALFDPDITAPAEYLKEGERKVNVSGLWTVQYTNTQNKREWALAVALERKAALCIIPASRLHLKKDEQHTLIRLDAPPLDVARVGDTMLVSLDGRKEGQSRLQAYLLTQDAGKKKGELTVTRDEGFEKNLECVTKSAGVSVDVDEKSLDGFLYGVADLRKRRTWEGGANGDQVDGDEVMADSGVTQEQLGDAGEDGE
jgi:tRNA (guanine-N(7)-)-methyltransferase subunit TRM82